LYVERALMSRGCALDDWTAHRCAVVWNQRWPQEWSPRGKTIEINGHDPVALITSAGPWDSREYGYRRAARTERVYGPFQNLPGLFTWRVGCTGTPSACQRLPSPRPLPVLP
jgi:hypothetical protein